MQFHKERPEPSHSTCPIRRADLPGGEDIAAAWSEGSVQVCARCRLRGRTDVGEATSQILLCAHAGPYNSPAQAHPLKVRMATDGFDAAHPVRGIDSAPTVRGDTTVRTPGIDT
jgi:hypothetical protein